ncbi:hypothetical protein NQ318_000466 [Aromia moschata]|uniref:Transposase n=1 Tax=Aromia moschata TaxID=1265417 RepID=A0AAV8YW97_9CUCU|nr:hypothetical protein NQ318_000466 [Aromia moschata]
MTTKTKKTRRQINEEREERDIRVWSIAETQQPCSSRQISAEVDVPDRTVGAILKRNKYHCYKVAVTQEIFPDDYVRRMEFCEVMMEKANENEAFIRNILFTDESSFALHGRHNSSITRYWSQENKHLRVPLRTQYPKKLMSLDINLEEIWYQQDGCPAHNAREVCEFIETTFPERVISGRGTIKWPPRARNLGELRAKIIAALQSITPDMLTNMRKEFFDRLGYCLAQQGGLFEPLIH